MYVILISRHNLTVDEAESLLIHAQNENKAEAELPEFQCYYCPKRLSSQKSLNRHIDTRHKVTSNEGDSTAEQPGEKEKNEVPTEGAADVAVSAVRRPKKFQCDLAPCRYQVRRFLKLNCSRRPTNIAIAPPVIKTRRKFITCHLPYHCVLYLLPDFRLTLSVATGTT